MGQAWSRFNKNRNAQTLHDLAPERTPGHENALPELDRDTLIAGLTVMARYIESKKKEITIIAVGGAINTIYLRSRITTHDLDFFNNALEVKDYEQLLKGAKRAIEKIHALQEEWFNNRTIFFIPMDQRNLLTRQAFQQNEIVFRATGLTVLAAPWHYAFCCKIDRLAGGGLKTGKSYDLDDAVQYIIQYIRRSNISQVPRSTVEEWYIQYSLQWSLSVEQILIQANKLCRSKMGYQYDVIVM